jgi:hypothetical protein
MNAKTLKRIKEYSGKGRIRLKKHAFIRCVERQIKMQDVEEALSNARIIASYPEDIPLKSYLLLGFTQNKRPLHIVGAIDEAAELVWIITPYEPDKTQWNDSLTERR